MQLVIDEHAGPKIREFLSQRPPTAAEIAKAGGFSRQYAWRVLVGREPPSGRFLNACEELGVPVMRILGNGRDTTLVGQP